MNLNVPLIIRITGYVMVIIGIAMIPCFVVSAVYGEMIMMSAFFFTLTPLILAGIVIVTQVKHKKNILSMREGILIVAMCWIWASLFGTIPYMLSGTFNDFPHAFFESVSGFTTTGSTILSDLPNTYRGLLFWRSLTTWLGGMGILVLAVSILPALGIGAQNIAKAETTGPTLNKLTTRISDNARILYMIYASMSVIEFMLLMTAGLDVYDALIHTFGSMGTGGLSNHHLGIAHFDSIYVEIIVSVFSVLAAINFVAYNHIIQGKFREFFKEPEIRTFITIMLSAALTISLYLYASGTYGSIGDAFRYGTFQIASFITTSGYITSDYGQWPLFCQLILFILMFIGGCSASTSGSVKIMRIMVMFKLIKRNMYKKIHPRAVVAVKMGGKPVRADVVSNITVFLLLFFLIFMGGSVLLSLGGMDMETAVNASISSLSNTGAGLGDIGYGASYDSFSDFSLIVMTLLMLTGRLELFTIVMLFLPSFWRPDIYK